MALQDHATVKVFVNNAPMTTCMSASKKTNSGQQPVNILETGLSGFTPGAGSVEIALGYSIPIGGPEFDFDSMAARGEYVDLQFWQGRKSYAGRGKIIDSNAEQSVGNPFGGTANWMGELKPNEG